MIPRLDAANVLALIVFVGLLVAVAVRYRSWRRENARYRARMQETLVGRQQLRAAARTEAFRQVGGAPIDRKTRRKAAREVASVVTKRKPLIEER